MGKTPFYESIWFIYLLMIIACAIYFGGVFYFAERGATFEQCIGWPLPWLFIGSIMLPFIQLLIKKIFKK